jgi:hypothetical protein
MSRELRIRIEEARANYRRTSRSRIAAYEAENGVMARDLLIIRRNFKDAA